MSTTRAWKLAQTVAKHNIRVIPVPPKEKGCKLLDWPELATSDLSTIQQWERQQPDGNYGVVCTPDTVVVLDADNPGLRSHIERQTGRAFPDTLTVKSSKGYHYWFVQTDKTRAIGNRSLSGMFDLQSDRKYVVGPGSIHPSGAEYTIINNTDIMPMPDWLAEWLDRASTPAKPKPTEEPEVADDFDPDEWYRFNDISGTDADGKFFPDECPISGRTHSNGIRDTAFFFDGGAWGFKCFASGCPGSEMSIGDVVAFVNQRRRDAGLPVWKKPIWTEDDSLLDGVDYVDECDEEYRELEDVTRGTEPVQPAVGPQEATKTTSGLKALATMSNDDFEAMLVTRSAADYQMEELRWMWPNKIPLGKMVLFTGKPDCGKSMTAVDVIARVTTGADWPDGTKNDSGVGRVLLAASEDDPKDTLIPRLVAAGADTSKVEIVVGTVLSIKGKRKKNVLNLKRDAKMLIETIKANPDIRLLVLDPITSYLGEADQNKDSDIRPIMDALKTACEKSGLTVIGIIHSNKRSDVDAVGKVSGAGSLAAAVRAVWGFSRDTEDKKLYHMAHVKGNLTADKSGLDYTITGVPVAGLQKEVPRITWGGKFEGDADDLLAAGREQKDKSDYKSTIAKAYLRTVKYPVKAKDLYDRAQQDEGLGVNVIKKAKIKLWEEGFHIIAKQQHDGWWWYHEVDGKLVKDTATTVERVGGFDEADLHTI